MTVQMQESPSKQVHAMLGLLTEQHDLYQQLKALSDQQSVAIREGSTEQLLAVLSQRQSVIDSLSRSGAALAPYRDGWGRLSEVADPGQRDQVRALLAEIEAVLASVVEQDDRDRAELKGVQQQIGSQLGRVNKAGRAIAAYGPTKAPAKPATFTDRQG